MAKTSQLALSPFYDSAKSLGVQDLVLGRLRVPDICFVVLVDEVAVCVLEGLLLLKFQGLGAFANHNALYLFLVTSGHILVVGSSV